MSAAPNRTFLVLGYGSLLSGYGLLAERRGGRSRLVALDAEPVLVRNARRGLAKPSSHGSYLAMDIEPLDRSASIAARTGLKNGDRRAEIGALLLNFARESAPLVARREEYDPEAFERLIGLADRDGVPLGQFLFNVASDSRYDLLEYRRRLRELVGYTSPGYVFHPVPLDDGRVAIVAIGSGYDGSGDPDVISHRARLGIDRQHALGAALELRLAEFDRAGQIGYFAECLLGGLHGVSVGDLLAGFDSEAPWATELASRFADAATRERERFLEATALRDEHFSARFGAHDPDLAPLLRLVQTVRERA